MEIEVRVIRADEFDAFYRLDQRAFQYVPEKSDPPRPDTWARGELDRAFAAYDGEEMVGIGRNYTFDLTVPGGARIPAGAVSWIGVSPTHRRRGVLTRIMAALAADSKVRGEAVSILTASEGAIYRRFGYGVAGDRLGCTIQRGSGGFVAGWTDPGRVRFVEPDDAEKIFPSVYERTRGVVGSVARPDFWWPEVLFGHQAESKFYVVHETNGEADGFAMYAVEGEWVGGVTDRTMQVVDLQGVTDTARLGLWRYLLDVDLIARVKAFQVPLDDPLRWALADVRGRRIDFMNDGLYIKVIDVAATLQARTYDHDDTVRLAIRGEGTFELQVNDGVASCAPTTASPDVELDADVLGAVVLGSRRVSNFVAAGGAAGDAAAIRRIDRLLSSTETPATLSYF
jgi:predicted acetyltransferase